MNVLLVDHAPFFGGAESFLLDLVSTLDRREFSPGIVVDSHSPVLDRFRATGEPLWAMPFPRINRSPIFFWHLVHAGAQLARIARQAHADVMHTFTARTHLIGAVAAQMSGIPLVWRICDDTLPSWAMTLFRRVPRQIVAVSHFIETRYPMIHFDGIAPDGTRLPLDISRAEARAELELVPDEPVVAIVGRLARWKGQAVFIRALAEVAGQIPNVSGLIVGAWHKEDDQPGPLGGGEPYFNELRELAHELKAPIRFAGFIRDPRLVYAAADVVVHASTLPEPFGRTIIEGMIAGRPVIATNHGAPPEIITHEEDGLLTPPGDVHALASALLRLLCNSELRARIGRAARDRAEANYTLEIMTRTMEEVYKRAKTTNRNE